MLLINNPNLFYRLDGGDHRGAFSKQGAYIKDGLLYPGPPKEGYNIGYTWWNKGKPYTYSDKDPWTPNTDINEGNIPSSRLFVTTDGESPALTHVRSQNYRIGQWTGKRGLVGFNEYVSPEPIKVSNNIYTWEPGYGYREVAQEPPTISWEEALKIKPFVSKLDWSPEGWFGRYRPGGIYDAEDVAALQSHIPEYNSIEAIARSRGTWMRDENGNIQLMDPREWIIRQSRDYKNANLTGVKHYNGVSGKNATNYEFNGRAWTDLEKSISQSFKDSHTTVDALPGQLLQLDYPRNAKILELDAKGRIWYSLPEDNFIRKLPTEYERTVDEAVNQSLDSGYDITRIKNIVEGNKDKVTDVVIHEGTPRKSVLGNNGNFDMNIRNIYKGLIPFGLMYLWPKTEK